MKFKLQITCDNAAFFADDGTGDEIPHCHEVSRILHKLADAIADDELSRDCRGTLRDINGNLVGDWKVTR